MPINTFYTVYMNRRTDEKTSHRIELTLLTNAAFGPHTARTFARLSGLDAALVAGILERPQTAVRQHSTFFLAPQDRRREPR